MRAYVSVIALQRKNWNLFDNVDVVFQRKYKRLLSLAELPYERHETVWRWESGVDVESLHQFR